MPCIAVAVAVCERGGGQTTPSLLFIVVEWLKEGVVQGSTKKRRSKILTPRERGRWYTLKSQRLLQEVFHHKFSGVGAIVGIHP